MNNQVYTTNKLHNTINIIQDSYITFTFHVSSFNLKKKNPITHTHKQNQQHASMVLLLLLLIYYIKVINKKVKISQPQVIYEIGEPTTKQTQTSLIP